MTTVHLTIRLNRGTEHERSFWASADVFKDHGRIYIHSLSSASIGFGEMTEEEATEAYDQIEDWCLTYRPDIPEEAAADSGLANT